MTSAARPFRRAQRVTSGIVVLLLVWPVIHFLAQRALSFDPWRLSGWAMYATLRSAIQVVLRDADGEAISFESLSREQRRAFRLYRRQRRLLGELADPEPLAASLFAELPGLHAVDVVILRRTLDPDSARIAVDSHTIRLKRDD